MPRAIIRLWPFILLLLGAPSVADADGLNPLSIIAQYESSGNPLAKNPKTSSSGLYGDVNGTWASALSLCNCGTAAQYPTANSAPASIQTAANAALFNSQGWTPWLCGGCDPPLAAAVQAAGGTSAFQSAGTLSIDPTAYAALDTGSTVSGVLGSPPVTLGNGSTLTGLGGVSTGIAPAATQVTVGNFAAFTWIWNTYQAAIQTTLMSMVGTIQASAYNTLGRLLLLDFIILFVCVIYGMTSNAAFWSKVFRAGLVVSILGAQNLYNDLIVAGFTDFSNSVGQVFGLKSVGAVAFDNLMQIFLVKADTALAAHPWWTGAWWLDLLIIAGALFFLGIILIAMWGVWFLSQALTELLFIIGPLLVLALLFDYTRHLFDFWISTLVHLGLLAFSSVVVADLTLNLMMSAYNGITAGSDVARGLLGISFAIFGLGCAVAVLPYVLSHISRGAVGGAAIWKASGAQAVAGAPAAAVSGAVGGAAPAVVRATAPAASSLSRG